MMLRVVAAADGHRLVGSGVDVELVNRFLTHLAGRNFAAATRRAYAFNVLSFIRFCDETDLTLVEVCPTDVFDYLGWPPRATAGKVVVRLGRVETAPATKNRRVAALRALFEHLVLSGVRSSNPVPAGRKVRAGERRRGLLGHLGNAGRRTGGRSVVQPRRLPESLELTDVAMFLAGLLTARDRAMVLAMLLGGLRSAEVRSLRLTDVDLGLGGFGWSGRAARNGLCRSTATSSSSSAATCARNGLRAVGHRSASSCCAARPAGSRWVRRRCGGSSAPIASWLAPRGFGRTGCGTPTAPSWPPPGSTCWCCGT